VQYRMSSSILKNCACPTPEIVEIPGSPGANGSAGTNGLNAFTFTTSDFVVPAKTTGVTIAVLDNTWVSIGQNVFAEGAGFFSVNSKVGTTALSLTYLDYESNVNAGATITTGAEVSPAGTQPKITGLGNNATQINLTAIAYAVTNAIATITGVVLTVPATGLYLVMARATLAMRGVTFSADRTLILQVQDTTSAATKISTDRTTGQPTTTDYPSLDYSIPSSTMSLVGGDVLELQIGLSAAQDAGTVAVDSADLIIVPLKI
jgi:hypothetical protein